MMKISQTKTVKIVNKTPKILKKPNRSTKTWHGFRDVMIRKDVKKNCFRGKIHYKGKTISLGEYSDPLTPSIIGKIFRKEVKYD